MRCIRLFLFITILISSLGVFAQEEMKVLHGKIVTHEGSKEGVMVINVTRETSVLSDDAGYFDIHGKDRDVLRFISPMYLLYIYEIKNTDFEKDLVLFPLERNKNGEVLEEIIITKRKDTYKGLFNYESKGPSPVERQLAAANSGVIMSLVNLINGRTTMLKKALAYEKEWFKLEKFLDNVSKERLVARYHIPYDYTEGFALYAVLNSEVKAALDIAPVDVHYLEEIIAPIASEFLELISQEDKKGVK
ncbi:hypothetical protein LNQ81_03905 [Myroides sp. M-43]|uniref:hypothetical protein n=1 Tax=Myroides oncorhynchi TaxID=2893756 RepID=UPI001E2D3A6B|nr:hypothetical protein [Myroides oncorhynchi]MCC9041844.1 hypothetical protein [Myroides oncorhynchi]